MGVLHETDSGIYPLAEQVEQRGGLGGRKEQITTAGTNLGNFLNKVGVTRGRAFPTANPSSPSTVRRDGAYPFDPNWQTSGTAALGDMTDPIATAQYWCKTGGSDACTDDKYQEVLRCGRRNPENVANRQEAAGFPDAQFQQVRHLPERRKRLDQHREMVLQRRPVEQLPAAGQRAVESRSMPR